MFNGPMLNDIDRRLTVFGSNPLASKVFIRGSALPSVGSPPPILALGKLETEIRNLFRDNFLGAYPKRGLTLWR